MFLIKISILLSALCCTNSLQITVEDFNQYMFLEKCVMNIVVTYSNMSDTILYLNFDKRLQDVGLNSLPVTRINDLSALKKFQHVKPDWYIITGTITQIKGVLLKSAANHNNWNPEARFIIMSNENIKFLFGLLEHLYILNVVVLLDRGNNTDIVTSFPYDAIRSGHIYSVGKCVDGDIERNSNLFSRKLPDSWKNITMNVFYVYYPPYTYYTGDRKVVGIEVQIFELIQKKIGFDVQPTSSLPNQDSKMKHVDILVGNPNKATGLYEDSNPILYDSFQWVVPVAKLDVPWYRLTNIFDYTIWLGLLAVIVIVPFIFYFLAMFMSDVVNYRRLSECFIMTAQCLIGHPVNVMPVRNPVRIFLAGFLMFSCVIIIAYQSRLLWDFYDDTKQISTLSDILKSNLKIRLPPPVLKYFPQHILNLQKTCSIHDCVNLTANEKTSVTYASKHLVLYLNKDFLGKNNESQIYFLQDDLVLFPMTIMYRKGFPLAHDINIAIEELRTHGFTEYFSEKADFAAEKSIEIALDLQYAPHPMNLKKLQGAFWILLLGWLIGILVVICEILYVRWVSRRN